MTTEGLVTWEKAEYTCIDKYKEVREDTINLSNGHRCTSLTMDLYSFRGTTKQQPLCFWRTADDR